MLVTNLDHIHLMEETAPAPQGMPPSQHCNWVFESPIGLSLWIGTYSYLWQLFPPRNGTTKCIAWSSANWKDFPSPLAFTAVSRRTRNATVALSDGACMLWRILYKRGLRFLLPSQPIIENYAGSHRSTLRKRRKWSESGVMCAWATSSGTSLCLQGLLCLAW